MHDLRIVVKGMYRGENISHSLGSILHICRNISYDSGSVLHRLKNVSHSFKNISCRFKGAERVFPERKLPMNSSKPIEKFPEIVP